MDVELRKQPIADEGAYDPNDEVADESKAGALYDLAGQLSGNEADNEYDQETFTRHVHLCILQIQLRDGQLTTKFMIRRSRQRRRPSLELSHWTPVRVQCENFGLARRAAECPVT